MWAYFDHHFMLWAFEESTKKTKYTSFCIWFKCTNSQTPKLQVWTTKRMRNRENTHTHTLASTHRTLILFFSPKLNLSIWDFLSLPQTCLPRFNTNSIKSVFILFKSFHYTSKGIYVNWFYVFYVVSVASNSFVFSSFLFDYYIYICL